MTQLIEFLRHLKTTVKLTVAIFGLVIGATFTLVTFSDSKIEASEKKIMELRREDMQRLETKLSKIDDDVTYIKRYLFENAVRAK